MLTLAVSLWSALFSLNSLAAPSHWWDKHEEGWFFYQEKPKEREREAEKKPEQVPSPFAYNYGTQTSFTEAMKKQGEDLLSRAMESPAMENVRAYMEHNRTMMALSKNFSLAWQKVLMSYPELMSGVISSDADKDIYYRQSDMEKKEALRKLAEKAGLLFIYDTTCPNCLRQARHLKTFSLEYPFFYVKASRSAGT